MNKRISTNHHCFISVVGPAGSAVSVSERAAEDNSILVRWNERVVIIHSYADVIEMKRANVRNCAFVAPSY